MYRLNTQQQQQQQQQQQRQQSTGTHIIIQNNHSSAITPATTTNRQSSSSSSQHQQILNGIQTLIPPSNGNNNTNTSNNLILSTTNVSNLSGGTTTTTSTNHHLNGNNRSIHNKNKNNSTAVVVVVENKKSKLLKSGAVINTGSNSSSNSSGSSGGGGGNLISIVNTDQMQDIITITTAATTTTSISNSSNSNSSSSNIVAAISNLSTNPSSSIVGTTTANTSNTNGHNMIYIPSKRTKLEGSDDWMSSPSPSSVPSSAAPLSPSPGSQNHNFNTNLSNGYASPMSTGSYDPYSPNGKMGREDLSPSSSLNGYGNDGCDAKKSKKGPAPRLQEELCLVCGDRASGYHYNALTCEGCKGFFRRSVTKNAVYCCKFGHACEMDMYMRRKCQECRLKKCLAVGMRPECVVPETQCAMKRKEKKAQKEKDKGGSGGSSGNIGNGSGNNGNGTGVTGIGSGNNSIQVTSAVSTTITIKNEILQLMKCDPPPGCTQLLPEKLLAENRVRNIPPLTLNQLAVIYKLIWYQDGYEQPSEEDLKRIMISSPDENESQHDISFRHITEITILTVQLIVEFAKGLPAFTKIPQEDQITLLKACSSEVMMLRMARRYDAASDSIFFANNRSYTRDSYKMAGMADNIEDLLHFCRQMYAMTVDNVEYALLTAIVIFSDRPGLEEAELVEAIQSYYIDTLRVYILNRHGGDAKCLVFFAKLLSILTELRTLGNQNAEMCFSLKLKNRKLPRFLEEIWDVHAIPPSVQSHLQATQQQQQQQDALSSSSSSSSASASNTTNGGGIVVGNNSGMISSDDGDSSSRGTPSMIGLGGSMINNVTIIGNNNGNSGNGVGGTTANITAA